MQEVREQLETCTLSTASSGVDAPGCSLLNLGWGVQQMTQVPPLHGDSNDSQLENLPQAEHLFAVEWYSKSQSELMLHPHRPTHVFVDMLDFMEPALRDRVQMLSSRGLLQDVLPKMVGRDPRPPN